MAKEMIASFTWTIKNFDMCPHLTGEHLCSPKFSLGSYEFWLELHSRENYLGDMGVYLRRLRDSGATKVLVKFGMYAVNETDDEASDISDKEFLDISDNEVSNKLQAVQFKKGGAWGCKSFFQRKKLLTTRRYTFLSNNNITVTCDVFSLSVMENIEDKNKLDDNQDSELLSRNFALILRSGIYSDMVLVTDKDKFSVHKAILECRCPKLLSQLKETDVTNEYSLDSIEAPVLQTLLEYLYTGVFKVANMSKDILAASGTYNVSELRHSLTFPYRKTICAITEIPISQLSFEWAVPNFSKLQLNQEFVYPAYCVVAHEWAEIEIILSIIKRENKSTGIRLTFRKLKFNEVAFIRCKISINSIVREYEHIFKENQWITPLGSQGELDEVLLNDTLDMSFEISMSKNGENSTNEKVYVDNKITKESDEIKNFDVLQSDLRKLYDKANCEVPKNLNQSRSEYVIEQQTSPDIIEQQISPDIIEQQTSTKITERQTSTKITERQTSTKITERQTSPNITERQTSPNITERQTSPNITERQTSPNIIELQTSPDITLNVGGRIFPAHKVILCARSRVFAKMFENDTLERKEGVVTIKDIDPDTVSSMLLYIYCGYIKGMDISAAIKLYAAADKYELLTLKDKCSNFLKTSMDADHIGKLLLLSDAHHDDSLRKCVYSYIASNPKKVMESKDGLSVLKNRLDVYPDAFKAILEYLAKRS